MELRRLRVLGVVHLVNFKYLLTADDDQSLRDGQSQHFIRGEHRPFANARSFPEFRSVVGNAPSAQLLGFARY